MTRANIFFEVKNPLASKVFGHANRLLVDLAFSSGALSSDGPKKNPINFVHTPAGRGGGELNDSLRDVDGLEKHPIAGSRDVLSVPSLQLHFHLIF
jgi:hypothetical protein